MGSSGSTDTSSQQQNISQTQLPPWVNQAAQRETTPCGAKRRQPAAHCTVPRASRWRTSGRRTQQAWNLAATTSAARGGGSVQRLAGAGYLTAAEDAPRPRSTRSRWLAPISSFVHEPVHAVCDQPDLAADATARRPEPKSGGQSGQLGQRLRRLAAGRPAGRRPGAGRDEHRPDGGATEPSELRPSADGGDRRHQPPAPGGAGQPDGQPGQHQFADPGGGRPRRARLPGADEPAPAIPRAVDRWRGSRRRRKTRSRPTSSQFNQAQQYPLNQLGIVQSGLQETPYGSTTMGSSTGQQLELTTTPSLMADVTGSLQALGSMAGAGGPLAPMMSAMFPTAPDSHTQDRHHQGWRACADWPATLFVQVQGRPEELSQGDRADWPRTRLQVAPHAVKTVGVHQPTGRKALHIRWTWARSTWPGRRWARTITWAGLRSGRAACPARTGRFRRACRVRSRRQRPWG